MKSFQGCVIVNGAYNVLAHLGFKVADQSVSAMGLTLVSLRVISLCALPELFKLGGRQRELGTLHMNIIKNQGECCSLGAPRLQSLSRACGSQALSILCLGANDGSCLPQPMCRNLRSVQIVDLAHQGWTSQGVVS